MKHRPKNETSLGSVLKGYARGFLGASLVILVAIAAVWPVWYVATAHTGLYTGLSLAALSGGLLYAIISRSRRRRNEASCREANQTP